MNESLFVECARWIYEHKNGVDWWTPYVLTEHNPNPNPHVNIDEAYAVFSELNRRRLMTHKIVPFPGKDAIPAFEINTTKDVDWQTLIKKKGFWSLKAWPFIKMLVAKSWLVIVFGVSVASTNLIGEVVRHYTKANLLPPDKHQVQSQPISTQTNKTQVVPAPFRVQTKPAE